MRLYFAVSNHRSDIACKCTTLIFYSLHLYHNAIHNYVWLLARRDRLHMLLSFKIAENHQQYVHWSLEHMTIGHKFC